MVLMRVLHLLSSFGYNGAAKESSLLARGLATDCDLRVCVLQEEGPWRRTLREVGVKVHSLGWARALDPVSSWRLRRLLNDFRPECIHVWRLPALRALAVAGRKYLPRCIVS